MTTFADHPPGTAAAQRASSSLDPELSERSAGIDSVELAELQKAIDRAAHLLPSQGPITVFIHHNTLHAFEDLEFTEAVQQASEVFGCQPYLSEDRYRFELGRGRIRPSELYSIVDEDLGDRAGEQIVGLCSRIDLHLAMLRYPLRFGPSEELLWFVAETDALKHVRSDVSAANRERLIAETRHWAMRDLRGSSERNQNGVTRSLGVIRPIQDLIARYGEASMERWSDKVWEAFTLQALWRVCCDGAEHAHDNVSTPNAKTRHRDVLFGATGVDADLLVHALLIPFCGAFLDQGLSHWQLPDRDHGFYRAFCNLYSRPAASPEGWLSRLKGELKSLIRRGITPLQSIEESLADLGVEHHERDDFLSATLLALPGWAGIIRFLEERGDRAVQPIPNGSLTEFLAIRLVLDRLALAYLAREAGALAGSLRTLREELGARNNQAKSANPEQRAFLVFQIAQVLGWTPPDLSRLNHQQWSRLIREIEEFSAIQRRRVFHLAYERRFYTQTLDAIAIHNQQQRSEPPTPSFQAMFCIDEREESLRRHIEELAPNTVTFSIAGFYFVDMYYRGANDAHFVPLCPAVMRPRHWVVEKPVDEAGGTHERNTRARRVLGKASHQLHVGSRKFAFGAFVSAIGGVFASAPLLARTLFPRLAGQTRRALGNIVLNVPTTRLNIEQVDGLGQANSENIGFTLAEMTDIAARVLEDTGLTHNFSRLVFTFGHGSTSMNNPHESAHDCGACGGAPGGPNGRAIARILNDPRVRERLKARGIAVPTDTVFVGGMHNTSSEVITFYDLDLLPESHRAEFERARSIIEEAGNRDAHERCRRFQSAPLDLSFAAARQHVEGRAEDLAQVRPEWGHATNAICIVGRRARTRGLFLDRRAFLNSYDPTQDDEQGTILNRILQAAVPVCAGISLEYYFSYVDNIGFGSGTKLPHNIASLLGVMDGAGSDLRIGLPWQMVEIHEPVRILFIIETQPEIMLSIMERNPGIARLVRNDWVKLATLSPDSAAIHVFSGGEFKAYEPRDEHLPKAPSSVDWYRGWRDHLEFAQIGE